MARTNKAKLTPFKIKRVALLFKKGKSPDHIARYLQKRYHANLSVKEVGRMYLGKGLHARRTNFQKLFGGDVDIGKAYAKWWGAEMSKRAKLRTAQIGKTLSQETIVKLSAAKKGKKNPMFGKTHTPQTKVRMSATKKGKTLSRKTRKKMSAAQKGRRGPMLGKRHTQETRKKMSATHSLNQAKIRYARRNIEFQNLRIPANEKVKTRWGGYEKRKIVATLAPQEQELINEQTVKLVDRAIKELSHAERGIVESEFYDGELIKDIAKKLGITVNEAKLRRSHALETLSKDKKLRGLFALQR